MTNIEKEETKKNQKNKNQRIFYTSPIKAHLIVITKNNSPKVMYSLIKSLVYLFLIHGIRTKLKKMKQKINQKLP